MRIQPSLFTLLLVTTILALGGCGSQRSFAPAGQLPDNTTWQENLTAPDSLRLALTKGTLTFIPIDNKQLVPVRIFGVEGDGIPILFTHGLQSHSGWFAQSAAYLSNLGHPVYVMDRMGSGLSSAPRGDIKDFRKWIDEIDNLTKVIMARHGHDSFYLVGHCFGAIPATAYAESHPEHIHGLILTTPAIYTTTSIPMTDMLRILLSGPESRGFEVAIPLDLESFSELPEYQEFIAGDQLSLKTATGDFYLQVYKARKYIEENVQQLKMPLLMVLAGEDPICDNKRNRNFFVTLPASEKTLVEFGDARHILEFSPEKHRFLDTLHRWLSYR